MSLNRRSFLASTCAAACGAVFLLPPELQAVYAKTLSAPLLTGPVEAQVVAFLHEFSPAVRLVGSGVLAKVRQVAPVTLHYLVQVQDFAALAAAFTAPGRAASLGASAFLSSGNTISFSAGGIRFEIENLTATDFTARLAGLIQPRNIVFAHDSLSYEPGSLTVSDPFSATRRNEVALVNTTLAGAAALEATFRGAAESRALGLPLGTAFGPWYRRSLSLIPRAADAPTIAGLFLRRVALLGDLLAPAAVAASLLSRTVATALQTVYKVNATAVYQQFIKLRPTLDGRVSSSVLWMALLLPAQLSAASSTELTWVQAGTAAENAVVSQVLAQARDYLAR